MLCLGAQCESCLQHLLAKGNHFPSLPLLVILWITKQEDEARALSPTRPWSAGRWLRSLLPGRLALMDLLLLVSSG